MTDHETLYMAGSKFFLYLHTQDRELASDELDIYNGVIDTLNEQMSRARSAARRLHRLTTLQAGVVTDGP